MSAIMPATLQVASPVTPAAVAPDAASKRDQSVSSVAKSNLTQQAPINEKNIKTSKWAILAGVAAVAITALAIATLQPQIIASALVVSAFLATACYGGFSSASEKRKSAKIVNDLIAQNQEIESYETKCADTISALSKMEFTNKEIPVEDARTIIQHKDTLINSLPSDTKNLKKLEFHLQVIELKSDALTKLLSIPESELSDRDKTKMRYFSKNLSNSLQLLLKELRDIKEVNSRVVEHFKRSLS